MAEVTIELIKALRERTGAGIMDCKKALLTNDADLEKAVDYLREKGIAKAATRANRIAAEGLTNVKVCEKCNTAVVVEVNCETDFVSGSPKFHELVEQVTDIILEKKPATLEEAKALTESLFTDAVVAMREKIELRRFVIVAAKEEEALASYIHGNGKISVLVVTSKATEEGKPLAMHIAANNPAYVALEDVPAADRARETALAEKQVAEDPKLAGKPEQVKAGIVVRKVDKVLSASCLNLQNYLMDDSKTVGQYLSEKGLKVDSFVRYQVGEGIVKTEAAE